ncbi:MAG: FAD-dependent oxidoreductase [Sinomicrobium sp.]|nr:FAD-dependent oxidoreductase [Sinomicrobium sp.]
MKTDTDPYIHTKESKWTGEALKNSENKVFWSDSPHAPEPNPALTSALTTDLVVVGGGFTGLWTALQAKEQHPDREIALLDARYTGFGGSSRNGGFCEATLVHGFSLGTRRWPREMKTLIRLGEENLRGLQDTVKKYAIDADIEATGVLEVATAPWQVEGLKSSAALYQKYGEKVSFLNREEVQREIRSPLYLAGLKVENDTLMLNPAKLVWGLQAACKQLGVRFFDNTRVRSVKEQANKLVLHTQNATVTAAKAIVGTNAWCDVVKKARWYIIPVYSYVLATEPLSSAQMASVGWKGRQGAFDAGNRFHYFRLTADNRIVWGGWLANHFKNNGMGEQYEQLIEPYRLLSDHFFETFPQLEGTVKFSHSWAGPLGATSRFSAAFGKKYGGKMVWAGGYSGLGVAASRFGARVALELSDHKDTEITRLKMVRKKPLPFPPNPIRYHLVVSTKEQFAKADANQGKSGLWVRLLKYMGMKI